MHFNSRHLKDLPMVSQLWGVGGMKDVALAVIVAAKQVPRTLLGCAWMCGTFALRETWIGLSRLGSAIVCYFNLTALLQPACCLERSVLVPLEEVAEQVRAVRGCYAAFAFIAAPSVLGDC